MKTKEEIEYLAANLANPNVCKTTNWIEGYTQCQEDNNTSKVTRVEVVDETGRVYSKWDCTVELSYQDGGRTLKVFVK
jgi:hypothetical protein